MNSHKKMIRVGAFTAALLVVSLLFTSTIGTFVYAAEDNEPFEFFIDVANATRWADTSVVYFGRATTEQNQYGHNVVVGADGIVIDIILGGDTKGQNLAIPEGGMVVSATGYKADWLNENIKLGHHIFYDSVSSRVIISDDGVNSPYYTVTHAVTGFNLPRYSNTFIIYDRPGTTETNGYGYEIVVNSEGTIISVGGNDNTVPTNGFVVSATESADREFLKMYGILGANVKIADNKKTITITYNEDSLKGSIDLKLSYVSDLLTQAKKDYLIIPYAEIEASLDSFSQGIDYSNISLQDRNSIFEKIDVLSYRVVENPTVEMRGVWHTAIEKNESEVRKVVQDLKEANINQLNLGINNGQDEIFPLPSDFPFKQKTSLRGADILSYYVEECKIAGIELVITLPVYGNNLGEKTKKSEWLTKSNKPEGTANDESLHFFSPASQEFKEYFISFLTYLYETYDFDGLQLDYIRYPGTDGGIDYGYDDQTKALFLEKHNDLDLTVFDELAEKTSSHPLWNDWIAFKADLVTDMVRSVRELTNNIRPDIFLSADVASSTQLSIYCQNTAAWVDEGLLDAIYPMTYGESVLQSRLDDFSQMARNNTYLFMGSGSYLNLSDRETQNQALVSRYKADGICYFEYLSFTSHGSANFLKEYAYSKPALSPTLSATKAAKAQIEYMLRRVNEVILPVGALSEAQALKIAEIISSLPEMLNLNAFDSAVEEIKAVTGGTDADKAIISDLAMVSKILRLSKDAAKAEYAAKKNITDTSEVSDSVTSEPVPVEKTTIYAIAGAVTLLTAAVFAIIWFRRKKTV